MMDIARIFTVVVLLLTDVAIANLEAGCIENSTRENFLSIQCSHVRSFPSSIPRNANGLFINNAELTSINSTSLKDHLLLLDLAVTNSELAYIEPGAFDHIIMLKRLNLGDNKITTLPAGLFSALKHLLYLNLGGNKLSTLSGVLLGLTSLETLRIENNLIRALPAQYLQNLDELKHLNIRNNSMEFGDFTNTRKLETLILNDNMLVSLDKSLVGLSSLTELEVENNMLFLFSQDAYSTLTSLKHLKLSSNHIATLLPGTFRHNANLTSLHLAHNPLTTVDNILPLDSTHFRVMNLSHCNLRFFPRYLPVSTQLIELSHNRISTIRQSDMAAYSNSLNALVLEGNLLESVEYGSFSGLSSLSTLLLGNNILETVPGPFPVGIKLLLLDHNKIQMFPSDAFKPGTDLNSLSIRGNHLKSIHASMFQNLKGISELHVENNDIQVLKDNTFLLVVELQYLSLNRLNLLSIFPDCFLGLTDLETLEMSFVKISHDKIYGNFFKNVLNVKSIALEESPDITHYFLKNVGIMGKQFNNLKTVNLKENSLTNLTDLTGLLQAAPNLESISLNGNEFTCDMQTSLTLYKQGKESLALQGLTCRPGRHLGDITIKDLLSTPENPSAVTQLPDDLTTPQYEYYSEYYPNNEYQDTYDEDHYSYFDVGKHHTEDEFSTEPFSTEPTTTDVISTHTITVPQTGFTKKTSMDTHLNKPPRNNTKVSYAKSVGIAIGTSLGVILVMLLLAFVSFKYCNKRRKIRQEKARQDTNGQSYVFIAPNTNTSAAKVHRKLSRAERGSTTSRASEDITNKTDSGMKVFTLDVDA
ncbi:chaoptin-like [Mya arenaria]|uniref:chaoptin-like n=1 Tax=Mya arenaria TaxID=6604 RepID=UPI0022E27445|nr:chaoptin-like [Mya arenaria]